MDQKFSPAYIFNRQIQSTAVAFKTCANIILRGQNYDFLKIIWKIYEINVFKNTIVCIVRDYFLVGAKKSAWDFFFENILMIFNAKRDPCNLIFILLRGWVVIEFTLPVMKIYNKRSFFHMGYLLPEILNSISGSTSVEKSEKKNY